MTSQFFHALALCGLLLLVACNNGENGSDAYGNFEATEVLVPAEATGKILQLQLEEGSRLEKGQVVGLIDTTQLYLKKMQLQAGIRSVSRKTRSAQPDIAVLEEQRRNLLREKARVEALLQDKAATPKQLDDLTGQIEVVDKQIAAARQNVGTLNEGILAEIDPLEVQIRQIDDQLRKSYIVNPIDGTVLLKLAEPNEFAAAGKPLYKVADLDRMILRAYVSGEQLPHVRIGQEVSVLIDESDDANRSLPGAVTWISDQAEFTPKIVQTKEERVNLVYAIKVAVKNDGSIKIGMPGEVVFSNN